MAALEKAFPKNGMNAPADNAFDITPNDSTEIDYITREVFVGGAGDLKVQMQGGQVVKFTGLVAGYRLAIRIIKVFSTDTTATNIIGLF